MNSEYHPKYIISYARRLPLRLRCTQEAQQDAVCTVRLPLVNLSSSRTVQPVDGIRSGKICATVENGVHHTGSRCRHITRDAT